ncbi:MAG: hypothetical protein ACOVOT_15850 [Rubrivivax sp.]|jgi:hypothetical protein
MSNRRSGAFGIQDRLSWTWRVLATRLTAVLLLAVMHGIAPAQTEDLTGAVRIAQTPPVPNPRTGTIDATFTVTNTSPHTLLGPLGLVLESASPASVALYNSHGRIRGGADVVELPLPVGTLAPGASVSVPVQLLTYGQPVRNTVFAVHGRRLLPAQSARLVVAAVFWEGITGKQNISVGGGWEVLVDGARRGVTNPDGRLEMVVPIESTGVAVQRRPNNAGVELLPKLAAGSVTSVKVIVDEGKSPGFGSLLRLQESRQGVLARDAAAVTLRVFKDERAIRLAEVNHVDVSDRRDQLDLKGVFSIQPDGSVATSGAAFMKAMAGRTGPQEIILGATDQSGDFHFDSVHFQFADHRLRVQLVAPPSNPGLKLAGLRITARMREGDLRFLAESDSDGVVVFPDMPAGVLHFSGRTREGGLQYNVTGIAEIARDTLVRLTLRGPADIQAMVQSTVVEALPAEAPRRAAAINDPTGPKR